jgi:hypothetical protein
MKNPRFCKPISSLLLFSFTLWSTGCYSTRELTRLDPRDYQLVVVTKGHARYTFDERWETDSSGAILGQTPWEKTAVDGPQVMRRKVITFPADSIAYACIEESEITVVTKDGKNLVLSNWMSNGNGGISGVIKRPNPSYSHDNWRVPEYLVTSGTIPVDSIASIQKSEFSATRTTLLVAGGIVVGGAILFGIAVGNAFRAIFSFE